MNKCIKCKKEVKKGEKQVVVSTLNRETKPDDHAYFHFSCWVEFFQESVNNKARADVEKMRIMAMGLLDNPMVRGVVEKIGAGDQLNSMLGTSLIKPQVVNIVTKKEVEKILNRRYKKRNDRKKTGKRKLKSD